jgi:hypothetical protein
MTNRRRIIFVIIGLLIGTVSSAFIYMMKNKDHELTKEAIISMAGNFFIAAAVIIGIGVIFLWNKKKR